MATAPALREELTELLDSGQTRLVVDLSDVETVDSAAIGALLAMLKLARKQAGTRGSCRHHGKWLRC